MSAAFLAAQVRTGVRSSIDSVDECLANLERDGADLGLAWSDPDAVRATARAADDHQARGGELGPLHGVPITVKDWIDVAGFPCVGEDPGGSERRPERDATVVARLRAAGAIVVAKTIPGDRNRRHRPVHNPHDRGRSPGGSSSGEGALVGAGLSPLGLGSDSGGSVRLPAAWCGVAGLKPSAGRVSNTGHYPRIGALHDARTQIGPLANTVDDLALVLAIVAGPDGHDPGLAPVPFPTARQPDALRVASFVDDGPGHATPAIAREVQRATDAVVAAGATLVEPPQPHLADALDITMRYWGRRELSGPDADLLLWDWDRFRRRMLEYCEHVDVIICPTTPDVASTQSPTRAEYVYCLPASLTGAPAVALPMAFDGALPIGVQLIGRRWDDLTVLDAARTVEAARPTPLPRPL